jgi:hypothetical protein
MSFHRSRVVGAESPALSWDASSHLEREAHRIVPYYKIALMKIARVGWSRPRKEPQCQLEKKKQKKNQKKIQKKKKKKCKKEITVRRHE